MADGSKQATGSPIVQRLLRDIADPSISVAAILRVAKIVATKLGHAQALIWINRELNGYGDTPAEEYPDYRMLVGSFRAFDPYRGWLPAGFNNPEVERRASTAPANISIGSIEHDLRDRDENGCFSMTIGMENKAVLLKMFPDASDFRVELTTGQLYAVVDRVRNLLLDWALELDHAGIAGVDMDFTAKEQQEGRAVTQQFFNGNVGVVGNVSDQATVTNNQKATSTLNIDAARSLLEQVRQFAPALPDEVRAKMEPALRDAEAAIATPSPDVDAVRGFLGSIKAICEGVVGNVVASGIVNQIGTLL